MKTYYIVSICSIIVNFFITLYNVISTIRSKNRERFEKSKSRYLEKIEETVSDITKEARSYWSRDGDEDEQKEIYEESIIKNKCFHLSKRIIDAKKRKFLSEDIYDELNLTIRQYHLAATGSNFGDRKGRKKNVQLLDEINKFHDIILNELDKLI